MPLQRWYRASELAGLPGMPTTVQGVNSAAARHNWRRRHAAGRGGGREYSISALPAGARAHLIAHSLGSSPSATDISLALGEIKILAAEHQIIMNALKILIGHARRHLRTHEREHS